MANKKVKATPKVTGKVEIWRGRGGFWRHIIRQESKHSNKGARVVESYKLDGTVQFSRAELAKIAKLAPLAKPFIEIWKIPGRGYWRYEVQAETKMRGVRVVTRYKALSQLPANNRK